MPSRTSRKLSSTWASEEESTTAENSDADTSGNCSETPVRVTRTTDSEEGDPSIVVRSTFLDVDEGSGLQQQYRKLRRTKSEDLSCFWHPRVYVPGEYSEKKAGVLLHPSAPEDDSAARALSERTETEASEKPKAEDGGTVMLRNLPNNYTREMLMSLLDRLGLAGDYDFMYLPFDFKRDANLGYAFVNLVSSEAVESLWKALDGFSDWSLPSSKVCQVKWSGPLQGFDAHVQRPGRTSFTACFGGFQPGCSKLRDNFDDPHKGHVSGCPKYLENLFGQKDRLRSCTVSSNLHLYSASFAHLQSAIAVPSSPIHKRI